MASRFSLLPGELQDLIDREKNKGTEAKILRDVNIVKEFLKTKDDTREIINIPPAELNDILGEFLFRVKRKDGKEYEPSSLRGILGSIQRYLNESNYGSSIINDIQFAKTQQAIKAKGKQLKRIGKGNKPNASSPLTDDEIDVLYTKGLLGCSTPESVINTVWLNNCVYFGMRGCTENRNLQWGDVRLLSDQSGFQFLELERQTKTRQGMTYEM